VVFDDKFSFVPHIEQVAASASKTLDFFLRNCKHFANQSTIKVLYNSYVRSKLECGLIVWSPIYNFHIQTLESVQRRFLKYLMLERIMYTQKNFSELPLAVPRELQSLSFLYKLTNFKIDCQYLLERVSFNIPRMAIRHQQTYWHLRGPTSYTQSLLQL